MRSYQRYFFWVAALAIAAWTVPRDFAFAEDRPPLKLVKTIELADIHSGESDVSAGQLAKNLTTTRMVGGQNHFHLKAHLKNNGPFVGTEDHKTIEVYNIRTGNFVHSIKGIGVGHSVVYRADIDTIFVTDGSYGDLKIFNGTTYELLKTVKLLADSDATGYDPVTHNLYIADGGLDAKLNHTFLEIVNTDTGKVLQNLPISTGVDDMVFDPASQRIYVAAGEGFVNVFKEIDADHYQAIGKIPTGPLGKTGLLVPELKEYFVAVPPHGTTCAEVLVFAVK